MSGASEFEKFEKEAKAPIQPIRLQVSAGEALSGEEKAQIAEHLEKIASLVIDGFQLDPLPNGKTIEAKRAFQARVVYGESSVELLVEPNRAEFRQAIGRIRETRDLEKATGKPIGLFKSLVIRSVSKIAPEAVKEVLESAEDKIVRDLIVGSLDSLSKAIQETVRLGAEQAIRSGAAKPGM